MLSHRWRIFMPINCGICAFILIVNGRHTIHGFTPEYNSAPGISLSLSCNLFPRTKGDASIMESIVQLVDSVPLLKAINRVRMYHAMIHLSDITSAARISMNSAMITYSQHATYYLSLQPGDMQWSCCSIRMGLVC